jgi:protein N-terminal amidase
MIIACLQFNPTLGQVEDNIAKANDILRNTADFTPRPADGKPRWLVLPELAFTGYNFHDLDHIRPFLEPSKAGKSAQWAIETAQQYHSFVTVGYPEKVAADLHAGEVQRNYNSTVTVDPSGQIVAHYRKRFLYYTDETWSLEGDNRDTASGFYAGHISGVGPVSMGICMDLNPYQFVAEFTAYEFANHVLEHKSNLVVVSMAWMTTYSAEELAELPLQPDKSQFTYWLDRLKPLRSQAGPIYVVLANRCGHERTSVYAGTSSVVCFRNGEVFIHDMLGKLEETCLVVDLAEVPRLLSLRTVRK